MTLEIDGMTVIERCMCAFYPLCSGIIVVTGKYHEDVKACLSPYSKVHIVYNREYREGMFRSVKEGVRHVTAERFFITPGDYPFLKADTVRRLIHTPGAFVAPVCGQRQGHPVLLNQRFIPEILHATCPSLRACLQSVPVKRQEVPVDDTGVITDLDTIGDYRAAIERQKPPGPQANSRKAGREKNRKSAGRANHT